MIRGLLLDYGGVIKDFERPTHPQFDKIAAVLGHDAAALEDNEMVRQLWARYVSGEMPPHDYAHQLLKHVDHRSTPEVIESLATMKTHQPFADMLAMTARLRKCGVVVGVLSNINQPLAACSRAEGDYGPFDFAILSGEVGERKPHTAMYTAALRGFDGTEPSDILYVDDTPRHLVPAAQLGMQTLLATMVDRPLAPHIISSIIESGHPIDFP